MRQLVTLCFLLITLSSCYVSPMFDNRRHYVRDYDSDAYTTVTVFQANSVAHRWRWYLEDAWITYDDFDTVSRIEMAYRTQNILGLKVAREKLVDFVWEFMEELQNNPDAFGNLSPDFTTDNLNIRIDFQSYWGQYCDPFCIGWVVLENGMVYYYDCDVKNRDVDYWYSRIESFNKSAEVVRIEREAEEAYQKSLPVSEKKSGEVEL